MIQRSIEPHLLRLSKQYKAVAVVGARQCGKTTLVKRLFSDKPYVSLENLDNRNFAALDTRGFLAQYSSGAIIDEAQRVPELFNYLQEVLDDSKKKGQFILTGSNNFLLQESITQSLAGRVAYQQLHPFDIHELQSKKKLLKNIDDIMLKGFYPPVYDQRIPATSWAANYIKTYIERDVRQIKNIGDLMQFERLMAVLAGRCGQELNLAAIGNEIGIDAKTVGSWVSILESSFIIFLLKPHHQNFNKTIVKRPKLYFYDTSIVCSLLRIQQARHLNTHPLRGALFENMVVSELVKNNTHNNSGKYFYYWRDKTGHEIDVLIEKNGKLSPIEIKSSATISKDFFKNLDYWKSLSKVKKSTVLYNGTIEQKWSNGNQILNWKDYNNI